MLFQNNDACFHPHCRASSLRSNLFQGYGSEGGGDPSLLNPYAQARIGPESGGGGQSLVDTTKWDAFNADAWRGVLEPFGYDVDDRFYRPGLDGTTEAL